MTKEGKLWKYEKHYGERHYYMVVGMRHTDTILYKPRFLRLEDAKSYGESRLKSKPNRGYKIFLVDGETAKFKSLVYVFNKEGY